MCAHDGMCECCKYRWQNEERMVPTAIACPILLTRIRWHEKKKKKNVIYFIRKHTFVLYTLKHCECGKSVSEKSDCKSNWNTSTAEMQTIETNWKTFIATDILTAEQYIKRHRTTEIKRGRRKKTPSVAHAEWPQQRQLRQPNMPKTKRYKWI